jgi:hypothetical protein
MEKCEKVRDLLTDLKNRSYFYPSLVALFTLIASVTVILCIYPLGWYHSSSVPITCLTNQSVSKLTPFTINLWGYHGCQYVNGSDCTETKCSFTAWTDVWKVGCGYTGPNGLELYCFDFDVAALLTLADLFICLCSSGCTFILLVLRVAPTSPLAKQRKNISMITIAMLGLSWGCCIICFIWYPWITDASVWEDEIGASIHLYWGWYAMFLCIVLYCVAILFSVDDFAKISRAVEYAALDVN